MTIVQRRIFYDRVGMANQLIELIEEGNLMARGVGVAIKPRILSDYQSGRTDRVVMEWEAEGLSELEAVQGELFAYPEGPELMEEFFGRLHQLIEYAEVETWTVH